jgi:SNF2 family DNA or RNA helicase
LEVSLDVKNNGVVDNISQEQRVHLENNLPTEVTIEGTRVRFKPGRAALDMLVELGGKFDPACRIAWAHFYRPPPKPDEEFIFKTEPYDHQRKVFNEVKNRVEYGLFWEMGLGKTKTSLDVLAWKYSNKKVDAALVITLKGVHENWVSEEIPTHLAVEHYAAKYWEGHRVEGGMKGFMLEKGLLIATINFDSIATKKGSAFIRRFLSERKVMLIIDESHSVKTPKAQRTKATIKIARQCVSRFILTGTPITDNPLDLWAQFEVLDPDIFPQPFWPFKARYAILKEMEGMRKPQYFTNRAGKKEPKMVQELVADPKAGYERNPITGEMEPKMVPTGKMIQAMKPGPMLVVGYKNTDELKQRIKPHSSRLRKEDCLDLPEKVYKQEAFELSPDQQKIWKGLAKERVMDTKFGFIDGSSPLKLMIRLSQIACGFIKVEDEEDYISMGKNPRIQALINILEQCRGSAIIWSSHRFSIDEIAATIKEGWGADSVVVYDGRTKSDDRREAINLFQNEKSRWFVGNPQAGGTGITLTAARDVIYYNNNFKLVERLQSEDRAHRIGQRFSVNYTDIIANGTNDKKIMKALRNKFDVASEITDDGINKWLTP